MPGIITLNQDFLQSQKLEATPFSIQSPITGWNTRDALDAMQDSDAVQLDNLFPDAGGCVLRNGYVSYATGMGTLPVKTVVQYPFGSSPKFFAATGGKWYDISVTGAGVLRASGFMSDAWQSISFNSRIFLMNGVDVMQVYDGTTFASATFTGVTLSTIAGGWSYQGRLFFFQNNSTGFWFGDINAISGALSFYDLSFFAPNGGSIIAITTVSHDGGNGVQDFIAFLLSTGDVLMYYGNDPSNINFWGLVGRYHISPPIGQRAFCTYGAESYIMTQDDYLPLQAQLVALKLGELPQKTKIAPSLAAAVATNPNGFGYQAIYYPAGRRMLFNIPALDGITFTQHIFNTATQAWCRFVNMQSYCWGLFGNNLFFGSAGGTVFQANIGNMDNGQPINGIGQQAWTMLPGNTRRRVSAARPVISCLGGLPFNLGIGFDYQDFNVAVAATTSAQGSPWDTSPWDTSPWSAEVQVDPTWYMVAGTGQALSVKLNVTSSLPVNWLRSDFRVEAGQAL